MEELQKLISKWKEWMWIGYKLCDSNDDTLEKVMKTVRKLTVAGV